MTLTTAWAIFSLAALAVLTGLWAAHISVNSTTRGPDWAIDRLPRESLWSVAAMAAGVLAAVLVDPAWVGLGVVYLAGVVAWTARAVLKGLVRIQDAGEYEPLPAERQAAVVRRVATWLFITAALGVAVTLIDVESRGGVALWDLPLVGVVAAAGAVYWRRAREIGESRE